MNENKRSRSELLCEIQIATFEAIETNLFLDTHPYNAEALEALRKYEIKRNEAIAEYENLYGPIMAYGAPGCDESSYRWVLEAFPWEMEDCD